VGLHAFLLLVKQGSNRKLALERAKRRLRSTLDDKDAAFKFLEKAYPERSLKISWYLKTDLRIDTLRSDPSDQSLLRRVELQEQEKQ
jgi:hypothetical protein